RCMKCVWPYVVDVVAALLVIVSSVEIWAKLFFFFFSSRRRHTRSDRDWSSDVCSSDLSCGEPQVRTRRRQKDTLRRAAKRTHLRSEERRVGKECRDGRWRRNYKKKKWRVLPDFQYISILLQGGRLTLQIHARMFWTVTK